jgi:FKBP-type peptidyl-prolyl cis-trans isomerase
MNKIIISSLFVAAVAAPFSGAFAQSAKQMEEYKKLAKRDAAIEKYLADNKIENVKTSPDGFYYVIETESTGAFPQNGKSVNVHYVGTRLDGKKFDSSRDRGQPFSFVLGQGQVIKGWDKGIPLFREGSRGKLFLPADAAYGERGAGADIPANTPLVFDIEVFGAPPVVTVESYVKAQAPKKFQTDANGLMHSVETAGTGAKAQKGDKVTFHFVGKFLDGRMLGDSRAQNHPLTITVGENQMLPGGGFDIAMLKLGTGGKGSFIIPAALALGDKEINGIPANSTLIFDFEVLEILDAKAAAAKKASMAAAEQTQIAAFAKANNLTIKTLPSGLNYYMEKEGTGTQAQAEKTVSVHYTGKLLDGKKFDSSIDRGQPIDFPLGKGNVIKGWDEGIALFKVGGKGKLLIPSYLAYGEASPSGDIPPNSILIFDIELMDVK